MNLREPIIITARLLAGVKVGVATISIDFAGHTSDGRTRYNYFIDTPLFEYAGSDLKSGVGGGSLQAGLESLLAFLSAAAESYAYQMRTGRQGENADLFPANVLEWAYQHSDELSMLACELEEDRALITN